MLTGWISLVGWQASIASEGFVVAVLIQSLALLNDSTYQPQPWQAVLLFYAAVFFAVFINTVVSRALPKIETLISVLHTLGFFAILIPLVYMAPHAKAEEVFTTFSNSGDFSTQGLSFMVGIVGPVFAFLGNPVSLSKHIS